MVSVLVTSDPRYRVDRKLVRKAVTGALEKQGITGNIEVSVLIVGNRKMRQLAKQYLGKEEDHDVLSFPFEDPNINNQKFQPSPDGVIRLGDIVVCHPQIVAEAADHSVLVATQMARMIEHSLLHLLGQHHED